MGTGQRQTYPFFGSKMRFQPPQKKAHSTDNVSLIGLPFYSLSKYRGMAKAVTALRSAGIAETLRKSSKNFTDMGDCHLSETIADSGPPNLRNFPQFLHDTEVVQEMAGRVGGEDFVFCLGGECALTIGTLAGFKNRFKGKPGMLWVDAHGDFNTPETTSSGFLGGMPLQFACGRGPKLTQSVEHARPLLEEENVVHLASRSVDPLESEAMSSSRMRVYSDSTAHKEGVVKVARRQQLASRIIPTG